MQIFSFFIGMAFGTFFSVLFIVVITDMEMNGEIKRKGKKRDE